jgi:hypothetical protein
VISTCDDVAVIVTATAFTPVGTDGRILSCTVGDGVGFGVGVVDVPVVGGVLVECAGGTGGFGVGFGVGTGVGVVCELAITTVFG